MKKIAHLIVKSSFTKLDIPQFKKFFNKGDIYLPVEKFTPKLYFRTINNKQKVFELMSVNVLREQANYKEIK